jgi:chromosome partitioning protein
MRKIAIVGFKGGIGKTTTCVNLGAGLALRGHRVLLIDTDTQANLAIALGVTGYHQSLADVLARKVPAQACLLPVRPRIDLLPSSLDLFKAQQRMVLEMAREEIFEELFAGLNEYDYQIIDCAPSLSLLTVNVMAYAEEIFVPVSMEMLALAGVKQLVTYLHTLGQTLGKGAVVRLVIPTLYDPRRRASEAVLKSLMEQFGTKVTFPIRIDTLLSEAPGEGKTIYEYAPRSRGAFDYAQLAELVAVLPGGAP